MLRTWLFEVFSCKVILLSDALFIKIFLKLNFWWLHQVTHTKDVPLRTEISCNLTYYIHFTHYIVRHFSLKAQLKPSYHINGLGSYSETCMYEIWQWVQVSCFQVARPKLFKLWCLLLCNKDMCIGYFVKFIYHEGHDIW